MKEYIPIFVALIGAFVGAYFAFVKTKTEKRWSERYDAFSSIIYSASVIRDAYEILKKEAEVNGYYNVVSNAEWEVISKELIGAKMNLRRDISKLQLLVNDQKLKVLIDAHDKLRDSLENLSISGPQDYTPDFMNDVIEDSKNVISVAIGTAK